MLLTRVLTAAVLIGALLAAVLLLGREPFRLLVAALVALAAWEWARLCGARQAWMSVAYAALCAGLYFYLVRGDALSGPLLWPAVVFWTMIAPAWLWRGFLPGPSALLAIAGVIVLVPAAVAMAVVSPTMLLALIGLTVVADTAAYFCGRAFGRHKLAPEISPGKTWEGAIGGGLGCLIYATICAMLIPEIGARAQAAGWVIFLCAIMLLCAVSILGDLLESALKRRAGVKDSGRLLPGHGGVLDRIDSATATLPMGYFLLQWGGAR